MQSVKQIALIGSTASGKSALGVSIAQKLQGVILSLDSLSIYRHIDIASAKPTPSERQGIPHYGIDIIDPDQHFDVGMFIDVYKEVYSYCRKNDTPLIIVGGSSFYLKTLLEGISPQPDLPLGAKDELADILQDLHNAYKRLKKIDPEFVKHISPNDRYRIEKGWHIYLAANQPPTRYFQNNPPEPIIADTLPIYEIVWDKELLRKRIALRTQEMIAKGLIDEVCMLEERYGRKPKCMKAIGIKETLSYLDGMISKQTLLQKIVTNTAKLAKRQRTFNRTQFLQAHRLTLEQMRQTFDL